MTLPFLTQLAHAQCERITKFHSKSFYKAFSLLKDPHQRKGVFAVYAFCRHVDDVIDDHHDMKALMETKNHLDDFRQGKTTSHFRWRALRDTATRFYSEDYDYRPFYQMIEGQEFDAGAVRIFSVEQLLIYSDLVASSVGHMLLPILAPNQPKTIPFANSLGRAFQITNILRDVGEDYRNKRIYLPSSLMEQFGYSEHDLSKHVINSSFKKLIDHLSSLAESYYQEAFALLPLFQEDVRFSLEASLRIYREILSVIKESGYQVFTKKQFVSDKDKLRIVADMKERKPL
jgi:phytoene synthase